MNHYVYFITNEDKMKYIGVRSSECSPEEDDKYWGSSKHLPKDLSETGVKEIVQVFDTRKEAVALEIYLHDKWNVGANPWFYNQAKQTSTGFDQSGNTKENNPGTAAMAEKMLGNTNRVGKHHSDESKAKMSKANAGHKHTKEHKAKISAATTGEKNPSADLKKYWFIHKLYGLVWCTRYYLRTHFNKPNNIGSLFCNNPREHCFGWSLFIGGDVSRSTI